MISKQKRVAVFNRRRLVLAFSGLVLFLFGARLGEAQNSTKKLRVKPSEQAAKIGSAVNWSKSFTDAMTKSKATGKPVFWYISSVPGTFMDRKAEIDQYMLGGPFSWPPTIEVLNENFIPLKALPGRDDVKFGIRPYQFVEPGFLILKSDGKVFEKVDRITTFHHGWMNSLLGRVLARLKHDVPTVKSPKYFEAFAKKPSEWIDPFGDGYEKNASNLLLSGMIAFRRGNHQLAKQRWIAASKAEPDSPLAWKAALESQGLGPFYRGFETYRTLTKKAVMAGTSSVGSAAPKNTYSRKEVVERSVDFLLGMQRQDGGYVDSDYDFGGTDSLPNVYVAVSSLVGMALLKSESQLPDRSAEIRKAVLKIESFVTNEENINKADRDEILWAYSYRLRFLSRLAQIPKLKKEIKDFDSKYLIAIKALENIQLKTGNWYHEYNNPFVTATALCALHEAKQGGGDLDMTKIKRGVQSLLMDRADNGTYPYYSVRRKRERTDAEKKTMLASSAGRMPICELALVLWGNKSQHHLEHAVANSLEQHRHLASGYKYDNHTSNMAYGGFFFWYDMRSRSEAIRAVEDPKKNGEFMKQQQALIQLLPEIDGCFVDSHELGRCYGTAMALLSME